MFSSSANSSRTDVQAPSIIDTELGKPSLKPTDTISVTETVVQPKSQRIREYFQFATFCWTMYLSGWNDGTTGPLLPRIQTVYNLNYTMVSLIFVFACIGYLIGAFSNVVLDARFGLGKVVIIGCAFQLVGFAIESAGLLLPFKVFALGYAINGIGMALQTAQANGYVASLRGSSTKLGIMHACYGAGALSAPLVATQFAQMPRWSFHYLVSVGIAVINTILLLVVFRFKNKDDCLAQIGQPMLEKSESNNSNFRQILGLKAVHLLAFFVLVYIGAEVTIGGWIVTYLKSFRHGGASSGYVSSGFFGGLMVGRVALLWLNRLVGERRVLFLYGVIAIGLEFVIWFVPSLIGDAVAASVAGVLLGPMYPITINHAGRILPPWLLTASIGWIAGFGQAGSALFPFVTGAVANTAGIKTLQPILVGMMVFMLILWALVPNKRHGEESS